MMKKLMCLLAVLLLAAVLSGCGVIQLAYTAATTANGVSAVSQAHYSNKMVKSFRDAQPLFAEYEMVKVETLIAPREEGSAAKVAEAFKDNFEYILDTDLAAAGGKQRAVCKDEACAGKTIVVQFKETGYNENMLQKLTVGDKLRGKLYFIDKQNGTVLRDEDVENLSSYRSVLDMVHISVATKLLKENKNQKEAEAAMNRINAVNPIKPEYAELFKES